MSQAITAPATRQENLRRVLAGEAPAWVPFSPNFWQWYQHHRAMGSLPPELRPCRDYLDAMKVLGCDIFSRNLASGFSKAERGPVGHLVRSENALGTRTERTIVTPHGTLSDISQEQRALTTSHQESYLVKDWDRDGRAFRAWFDGLDPVWDDRPFRENVARIGADGLVNLSFFQSPLKFLHQHFGLDHTCIFVADHPDEAKAICDELWARQRPLLVALARDPQVASVILQDNVDTPFYPPRLMARYWAPYIADAVSILRPQGKHLFVHACGKLRHLAGIFAEVGVSGLEGISHAPLGDWGPTEACACHERFVYIGGWSAAEQTITDDAAFRDHYARFLAGMPKSRVIFSSSCNTAIETPWVRLLLLRDLVRAWGGRPPGPAEAGGLA